MIVKMSEVAYKKLKEVYIYDISKNGLVSTKPINGKSYLFRSTVDGAYQRYLKVTGASEEFLRVVLTEARGDVLTFIESPETKDVIVEVKDENILPQPTPPEVIEAEVKEVSERIVHEFRGVDVDFEWQDYEGFQSY